MKKLLFLLFFIPLVFACGSYEDDCMVSTKKVLIVYPEDRETLFFTDFKNIVKDFWTGGTQTDISIDEFNSMENKDVFFRKDWEKFRLSISGDVKENQIYIIEGFRANIYNNQFDFDLNPVWDFNDEYQYFIYNKTDKDLYLEARIYSNKGFTETKIPTIKIKPNQLVESVLPSYFFEDEPPNSIKTTTSYGESRRYWLRY